LAWSVATGTIQCEYHNYYNYEYYVTEMMNHMTRKKESQQQSYTIVAIRAEHLEQDLDKLKIMFGDTNKDNDKDEDYLVDNKHKERNDIYVNKSVQNKDNDLSKEGRNKLCYALCNEIQHYKWILDKADNLNIYEKEQSYNELYELCPKSICE